MQVPVRVHDACFTSGVLRERCSIRRTSSLSQLQFDRARPVHYFGASVSQSPGSKVSHEPLVARSHLRASADAFTSCAEVLGSMKCDCAEQLQLALSYIRDNGPGVVIYLQQEGRGIGLANKIAAYSLQVRARSAWSPRKCETRSLVARGMHVRASLARPFVLARLHSRCLRRLDSSFYMCVLVSAAQRCPARLLEACASREARNRSAS